MYWSDRGTDKIEKACLDGTERTPLLRFYSNTDYFAIAVNAGFIYFTDRLSK